MYDVLLICLFVLMAGACIGSFLNVVALRALSKESIVFPASKCPECNEPIKWYDNIPVLSYLFTFKGKCRNCGCKVSIQYPIVEAITAILFLAIFIAFGATLKTLILLLLVCISIVMTITDMRREYIFDAHLWTFIAVAVLYSVLYKYGVNNTFSVCVGLLSGALIMEALARLSYYLIRKQPEEASSEEQTEVSEESVQEQSVEKEVVEEQSEQKAEDDNSEEEENEEDIDINEYVQKHKRAFGEGDTYLAMGAGALLGWKYFLVAVALAIVVQAACILPQFFIGLYKQKEYRLLISLSAFTVCAILYWLLTNMFTMNLIAVFCFVILLAFFAIDSITRLKKTVNQQGFAAIPFGPALLVSTFTLLFWGKDIVMFLKKYIFMVIG